MSGDIPPPPNTPSWRGAQLRKAQGQPTFYLLNFTVSQIFLLYLHKHYTFMTMFLGLNVTYTAVT